MTRFETIPIPPLFWDDLKQVRGMFVQSRIATIREELTERYSANQLAPLIAQVRKLLLARNGAWNDETVARRYVTLLPGLHRSAAISKANAAYRQVLESQTPARVPLD